MVASPASVRRSDRTGRRCLVGCEMHRRIALGDHLPHQHLAAPGITVDQRVHRSRIVNIHKTDRAEPLGDGRLVLHMESGEPIQTSRAGAKSLRNRVI